MENTTQIRLGVIEALDDLAKAFLRVSDVLHDCSTELSDTLAEEESAGQPQAEAFTRHAVVLYKSHAKAPYGPAVYVALTYDQQTMDHNVTSEVSQGTCPSWEDKPGYSCCLSSVWLPAGQAVDGDILAKLVEAAKEFIGRFRDQRLVASVRAALDRLATEEGPIDVEDLPRTLPGRSGLFDTKRMRAPVTVKFTKRTRAVTFADFKKLGLFLTGVTPQHRLFSLSRHIDTGEQYIQYAKKHVDRIVRESRPDLGGVEWISRTTSDGVVLKA